MSATQDDYYYAPKPGPPVSSAMAALQFIGAPLALIALPVFLAGDYPLDGWWVAIALWVANRTIQWASLRFIIGLPQTIAVAVAGIGFLTRAWGSMIVLLLTVHFAGKDVAVPAAILFTVLYTADLATRGLLFAQSRRRPSETGP
jgi:hypothetical protein